MTLELYLKHRRIIVKNSKSLIEKLRQLTRNVSVQYALYYYLWTVKGASIRNLHRLYNEFTGRMVAPNTVRKQLKILERKGLIKKLGDTYIALVEPQEVLDLFDARRSKAGRKEALKRSLGVKRKKIEVPLGLSHYVKEIVDETKKLIAKGDRTAALDLLVHTLLPLRETEALWLWHDNTFIYWNSKSRNFRAVESKDIAELLRKLGYREGVMIFHTLAHEKAKKVIHRIFNRGSYSWPWARSLAYGLKELELLKETNYRIQIKRIDNRIVLTLYDFYTKHQIAEYTTAWIHEELPEPMKNKNYYMGTVLGKTHVKQEIEENNYFSKWRK
ncbi:MAG: hypothetical protein DRO40_05815 [Thermoprotei archaeon]|nr:MAG: hypothetical protein DRO40_05815 [Thermoprotei archaeon]